MKKVLLIYPQTGVKNTKPQSPLSLLTLCPGLEEKGFQPIVVDTRIQSDYKGCIKAHINESIFVGISTMTGHQIHYALEIAQFVRSVDPDKKIVWGGIHPSICSDETIKHPLVDVLAKGEGEELIVELAECLQDGGNLSGIKGIIYKKENGEIVDTQERPLLDLKTLKMPSWHLVKVGDYYEIGVQTGRGCPWSCTFCYNIKFNRRKWRSKSVDQIIEELTLLKEKYNVEHVNFYDDNYFSNQRHARQISKRLIKENLNIRWSTTCRADYLAKYDDEFCELLKRSGVHILYVGSESGSPGILEYIKKKITTDDIQGMARTTKKHKLRVHTSFMLGFPTETEKDRQLTFQMMDKIKSIDPDIYITTTCIYTPYPGNEMFEDAIKEGFEPPCTLEEWARFSFFECQLPWLSKKERTTLENLSFITRFVFWHREIKERYLRLYHYPFYYVLRTLALLRWKMKIFGFSYEWVLFRRFVRNFID